MNYQLRKRLVLPLLGLGKKEGLTPELVDLIFYAWLGGVDRESFGAMISSFESHL